MSKGIHQYEALVQWTGNRGTGTSGYRDYGREHTIQIAGKAIIEGSSDPAFRGDDTKHNPEELLLAALSTCHMLSYLHLCAVNKVVVLKYEDRATATMLETPEGGGHFSEAILNPVVLVADASMIEKANELHHQANRLCFIANSVNFPVKHVAHAKVEP
ncbi:MAG: OsmC family protein [Chitinophagaceae bacterium]